jgi:DNA-binding MarR family transcriptional regulator
MEQRLLDERRDLLASLLPIARALRKIEDAAAAGHGVSMWQYAALALVAKVPGLSQREAADRMDYSRNRIIADLDHLEKEGLLIRRPGSDRRANVLEATRRGVAVMQQVRAEIHRREDELLADLSPDDRRDFDRTVRLIGELVRR